MMFEKKNGLQALSLAEEIGILGIILGSFLGYRSMISEAFFVPILFLGTGYLLRRELDVGKKLARKLVVAYLIAALGMVAVATVKQLFISGVRAAWRTMLEYIWIGFYASGRGYETPYLIAPVGILWILPALLFAVLIVDWLKKYKYGLAVVILLAYLGYRTAVFVWLPFGVQAGMVQAVLVYVGYYLEDGMLPQTKKNQILMAVGASALWICYCFLTGEIAVWSNNVLPSGLLDFSAGAIAAIGVLVVGNLIGTAQKKEIPGISFCGEHWIEVLCVWQLGKCIFGYDTWSMSGAGGITGILVKTGGILASLLWTGMGTCVVCRIEKRISDIRRPEASTEETVRVSQPKKRDSMIDIAKGIAILLMVYGHCGIEYWIFLLIFSFHMPLFFITSGYFLKRERMDKVLIKRVKNLLWPYIKLNILVIIVGVWKEIFYNSQVSIQGILELVKLRVQETLMGISYTSTMFTNVNTVGVTWFMICLFWAILLFELILNLSKEHTAVRWGLICITCIAGWLIGTRIAFLPASFDVAMVAVTFLGAGYEIHRNQDKILKSSYLLCGILGLLFVWGLGIRNGGIELSVRNYPHFPLPIIAAIAGTCVVLLVSRCLGNVELLKEIGCFFGENSLIILGIHNLELRYCNWGLIMPEATVNMQFLTRMIMMTSVLCIWKVLKGIKKAGRPKLV